MIVTISSSEKIINWGAKDDERIIQNVRNIIRTKKFEVPFMRDMGLSPDHLDSSTNHMKSNLASDVMDAIKAYEDRVNVIDVIIDTIDENGNYEIIVKLEV